MSEGQGLSAAFLSRLPQSSRAAWQAHPTLERDLQALLDRARAERPDIGLPPVEFLGHVAARLVEDGASAGGLAELHAGDLYLVCACVRGHDAALGTLVKGYLEQIPRMVAQLPLSQIQLQELSDDVRRRLFEHDEQGVPKLARYAGLSPLWGWLKVLATRAGLNLLEKKEHKLRSDDDTLIDRMIAPLESEDDPESLTSKAEAKALLRQAATDALGKLDAQQRNLLRYCYLESLTLQQIGAILHLDKASICRRLQRIRTFLGEQIRAALRSRLNLRESEAESLASMAYSQIDLSLSRILRSDEEGAHTR